MDMAVLLAAVAAMVWVWRRVAAVHADQGRGWYLRNVLGGTIGAMVWLLVVGVGGWLGAFSADGGTPAPETAAEAATRDDVPPPPRVPVHGPLLDGDVPDAIATMFGDGNAMVDRGVLTVYLDTDSPVTRDYLTARVGMLCMSLWMPPEDSDHAPTTPVWSGVVEFRVINRKGWGLAFDGGDADCDAIDDNDLPAYVVARSRPVFE